MGVRARCQRGSSGFGGGGGNGSRQRQQQNHHHWRGGNRGGIVSTRAFGVESVEPPMVSVMTSVDQIATVASADGASMAMDGASQAMPKAIFDADAAAAAEEAERVASSVISAFRPTLNSTEQGFSLFRGMVTSLQNVMAGGDTKRLHASHLKNPSP